MFFTYIVGDKFYDDKWKHNQCNMLPNKPISLTVRQNPVSNKDTKRIFCQHTHTWGDSPPVWPFPDSRQTTWQACDATMRSCHWTHWMTISQKITSGSAAVEAKCTHRQYSPTVIGDKLQPQLFMETLPTFKHTWTPCILRTEHLYILHMIKKTKKKIHMHQLNPFQCH